MGEVVFSILIPTINNRKCLELAIKYIEKHTLLPYEVLIYDNGSSEEDANYIASLPHKSLRSDFNIGVSRAYNKLAKIACGKFFLFWDDDKLILPGWDIEILPLIDSDGVYGWRSLVEIWPYDTNPCSISLDCGRSPQEFDEALLFKFFSGIVYPEKVSLSVSQLMTRELFFGLGGYDEKFYPGFGSDPDIMWRAFCFLGRDPKKFANANKSFYYHFTSSTTNRIFKYGLVTKALRAFGHLIFLLKHGFLPRKIRKKTRHGSMLSEN